MDLSNINDRGNVSDERGRGGKKLMIGGGIGGLVIVVLGALGLISPDMQRFLQAMFGGQQVAQQQDDGDGKGPPQDGAKEFSEKILGSSDRIWQEQFQKHYGKDYRKPKMRLFEGDIRTGCGLANSGIGPFYCPADEMVYLDPSFFEQLEKQLKGSAKDFSKAYVIAHEVGHHVQHVLDYDVKLKREGYEDRDGRENAGIRLELQADYLAGVWAHHADKKYRVIQPGDVEAAFQSAKAIGDDTLQKRGRGTVNPESFNHGTSAQRLAFFRDGLKYGDASRPALEHFFDKRVRPLDLKPMR
jgi:uncharacterized protein